MKPRKLTLSLAPAHRDKPHVAEMPNLSSLCMHVLKASYHIAAVADECLTFRHLAHWKAPEPTPLPPAAPTAAKPAAVAAPPKILASITKAPFKGNDQGLAGKLVCPPPASTPAGQPPASSGIPSQPASAAPRSRAAPSASRLLPISSKAARAGQTGSAVGTAGASTPSDSPAVVGGFLRRDLKVSVTCLTSPTPINTTPAVPPKTAPHYPPVPIATTPIKNTPAVAPKKAPHHPPATLATTNPATAITLVRSDSPKLSTHKKGVPPKAVAKTSAAVTPTPLLSTHESNPSQGPASFEPQAPAASKTIGQLIATRLCEADSESVQASCDLVPLAHYVVDALGRRGSKSRNHVLSQWGQVSAGKPGELTRFSATCGVL